jgi:HK97 family phage major capsid protein
MAKLKDVIAKAIADAQTDIQAGVTAGMESASAKSLGTSVPKPLGTIGGSTKLASIDQERVAELGFITKSLRGGTLRAIDLKDLNARAKAVGLTTDVTELLPSGFTGALLRDIQDELNVAKLFPMRTISGGVAYDSIALYGITAYLTAESITGTDSAENYKTFVATTQKVMTIVRKSYEVLDDSLIDIASEVRMGIIRAIAEAVEVAVINGCIAGTQDGALYAAANSAARVCNGIRFHGLNKKTVDASGVDYTTADGGESAFLDVINAMQIAGGKYLDKSEVGKGNVVLIIDQVTYGYIRKMESYKTKEKAGNVATLFGGKIDMIFDIPFIVTSGMPSLVTVAGVVDTTTPANNVATAMYMLNVNTMRLSANGNVVSESDRDVTNMTFVYTGSLRFGFASVYDSTEAAINTVTAAQINVVAGIALSV